jgi:hypothetical protein
MYSGADYLEMIIIFGECERNAREAARVFEERFPGRNDNYFFVCNTFFVFFATIRCYNKRNDLECHLVATIKHQPLPHESDARGPTKTKLESEADLVIPAKNHRWVLRIRASVTDLLSDPTLVARLRSVESLHSKTSYNRP